MTRLEMEVAADCLARKRGFDMGKQLHEGIENGTIKHEGKNAVLHERYYLKEMDRINDSRPPRF